jgi:hypothetical protein
LNVADIYKSAKVDEATRRELDAAKLLSNGNFLCDCHALEVEYASLDRHHRVPEECGGPTTVDNMAYLCTGCHQLLHRLALMMMASKAKTKKSPLEAAESYAQRVNPSNRQIVVVNLLTLAQLVTMYKIQKSENEIAPPDSGIVLADMPNEFKQVFKQIAWEIKRGDGRGIGMANLGTLAVLQLVSTHRPELKETIDTWIGKNILYVQPVAKQVWQAIDEAETPL